jgi:hypothetical protein
VISYLKQFGRDACANMSGTVQMSQLFGFHTVDCSRWTELHGDVKVG